MKKLFVPALALSVLCLANVAHAKGSYNDVAADDKQFMDCIVYSKKNYTGGDEVSPIAGQSKAVAYCECLWNETSDDFRGNLAKFAETEKGKKIDRICAKYANWE